MGLIAYDFEYYLPSSISEAIHLFEELNRNGKEPIYFSGGTEIITLGRLNAVKSGAVININQIADCQIFDIQQGYLLTGAVTTLTKVEEMNRFPLLGKTVSEIADRTARNKITVGGNVCGQIFYREAVLPFLLSDSQMVIAGSSGVKSVSIHEVFNQALLLEHGEFLVQIKTAQRFLNAPFASIKKRRQWKTGYPLITVAALKVDGRIRIAISGLTSFPFRSPQMEEILNNSELAIDERIARAIHEIKVPPLHDSEGSFEYRMFVLKNTLYDVYLQLEGGRQNHG